MKIDKIKLQVIMADNCLTVNELSKKAEISRVSLTRLINGKVTPKPITVGKIARALGVKVTDIIEDTAATVDNAQ